MIKLDIDIYNATKQRKSDDEIYVGHIPYLWNYSVVSYTADRIIAVPFTIFDSAICKILEIVGTATRETIGDIMGLNIKDDPDNNFYADDAEVSLLNDALFSLLQYKMIQRTIIVGVELYSLTSIGKENLRQGKKFVTHESEQFDVFYDLTTLDHKWAKKAFSEIEGEYVSNRVISMFKDEEHLKSFLSYQSPEIYDPTKGNSFTNLRIGSVKNYILPLNIAFLFNAKTNNYRSIITFQGEYHGMLTEIVSENESIGKKVIANLFNKVNRNPEIKTVGAEYIAEESFWSYLPKHIPQEAKYLYFSLDELTMLHSDVINSLQEERPDLAIFILYRRSSLGLPQAYYGNSVFLLQQNNLNFSHICQTDTQRQFSLAMKSFGFEINSRKVEYQRIVVIREDEKFESESFWLSMFADVFVPKVLNDVINRLDREFRATTRDIQELAMLDAPLSLFYPYVSDLRLRTKIDVVVKRKRIALLNMKRIHDRDLYERFVEMVKNMSVERSRKLDEIQFMTKSVLRYKTYMVGEEGYTLMNREIQRIIDRLTKQEMYIRQELMARTFIIDTNVFLDDPNVLSHVSSTDYVCLSLKVLDELDKFKIKEDAQRSENAVKAIKSINDLAKKKYSRLRFEKADIQNLPSDLSPKSPDNLILCVAIQHKDHNPFMITSDKGLQNKCTALGIPNYSLSEFIRMTKPTNKK